MILEQIFLSKIQLWSRKVIPPWFDKSTQARSKHSSKSHKLKHKKSKFSKPKVAENVVTNIDTIPIKKVEDIGNDGLEIIEDEDGFIDEEIVDLSGVDLDI